jgi:hypothetical protein
MESATIKETAAMPQKGIEMGKHYPKGLDDRMQDKDGHIRQKRNDTKVETLREDYGENFAKGTRSDATLKTALKNSGFPTLSQLLKNGRKKK